MPFPSTMVGTETEPMIHDVDERWLMAYAAALGDLNPRYLDTTRAEGIVGHPLFPVCVEWDPILRARDLARDAGVPLDEIRRGVHASHDLHIHRPIRPGDRLSTTVRTVGVEQRRPGVYQLMRLSTVDAAGEPVATTWQGSIYLGVEIAGPRRVEAEAPAHPVLASVAEGNELVTANVAIDGGMAHTYTECARIWNPIHTDRAVALAAGLPDIILHGTATHALGVTYAVDRWLDGDGSRVRRITGRFGAMVLMPSNVEIVSRRLSGTLVEFGVMTSDGGPAIRDAVLEVD